MDEPSVASIDERERERGEGEILEEIPLVLIEDDSWDWPEGASPRSRAALLDTDLGEWAPATAQRAPEPRGPSGSLGPVVWAAAALSSALLAGVLLGGSLAYFRSRAPRSARRDRERAHAPAVAASPGEGESARAGSPLSPAVPVTAVRGLEPVVPPRSRATAAEPPSGEVPRARLAPADVSGSGGPSASAGSSTNAPVRDYTAGCASVDCHREVATSGWSHGSIEAADCSACHAAEGAPAEHRFRRVAVAGRCLECHDGERAPRPGSTGGRGVAVEIAAADLLHGPVREGDCLACHFAHESKELERVREGFSTSFYQAFSDSTYALCFRCHDEDLVLAESTTTATRFRDGERNLHRLHVHRQKGRSCGVCHAIHGSDLPAHLRHSVPFGRRRWELPIGFQKSDSGGSCSPGCHRPVEYRAERLPGGRPGGR